LRALGRDFPPQFRCVGDVDFNSLTTIKSAEVLIKQFGVDEIKMVF